MYLCIYIHTYIYTTDAKGKTGQILRSSKPQFSALVMIDNGCNRTRFFETGNHGFSHKIHWFDPSLTVTCTTSEAHQQGWPCCQARHCGGGHGHGRAVAYLGMWITEFLLSESFNMSNIKYRFYKYINLYVHVCVYIYIYNVCVCVSWLNHNLVSYLDVISAEFCAFWVRKSRGKPWIYQPNNFHIWDTANFAWKANAGGKEPEISGYCCQEDYPQKGIVRS